MIVDIKPECVGCKRLELPLKALDKADELDREAKKQHLRAQEFMPSSTEPDFETEAGRFIPFSEAMGFDIIAKQALEMANGLEVGANALRHMAYSAIEGCQKDCPGVLKLRVGGDGVCQGNRQDPYLQALIADYGNGGLELSDSH